jgi:enoyl-CoA hydratase/carnithine racemase
MYQTILYSVADHVATITLNRPDRLNAWTGEMENEIRDAMTTAGADQNVRAILVTGAGRGFCAGADMSILTGITAAPGARETVAADNTGNFGQKFSYLLAVPKPIFMAINGPIAGIGLCLAVFGDFRYMAAGTKLTTAFAKRGLIAEHGISWMLPRLIGNMNAMDLLCSARTVQAEEAERMGLVRTLPAEGFLAAVQGIAREMATTASPRSIGVIKRQVYEAQFQSLAEAWAVADREMAGSFSSEDFKEGVAHFVEKRAPAFTGR